MNIRHILAAVALILAATTHAQTLQTCAYKWSAPGTLTPAYEAPTAADRYGQYIGKVEFTSGPTTLYIDDSAIKELSQSARFLYGYVTREVEMRAYPATVIRFAAKEGYRIISVEMEGAKVGPEYLSCTDGSLVWSDPSAARGVWNATAENCKEATLYVDSTINCTLTRITVEETSSVSDIKADENAANDSWFTLHGQPLPHRPTTPGVYVRRQGTTARLQVIR